MREHRPISVVPHGMIWAALGNSLLVAVGTMLVSLGGGALVALWARTLNRWGQRAVLLASLVTLVLPSFLVTNTWLDWLGPLATGPGASGTPLFSVWGVIWILSLQYWSVAALALGAVWAGLPRSWMDIDPELNGVQLFRRVLYPTSRDALLWSALLIFTLSVNQVSVPALLQVKVLAAEIWTRYATDLDAWSAFGAAWPLLLPPLMVMSRFRGRSLRTPSWVVAADPKVWKRQLGRRAVVLARAGGGLIVVLSLGVPLLQLMSSRRTWAELPSAVTAGWPAMLTSIRYAATVASIALFLGLWAYRRFVFRRPGSVQGDEPLPSDAAAGALGVVFLLPGMLLGIAAIGVAGAVRSLPLYGTSALAILALVLHVALIGWLGARMALGRIDHAIRDSLSLMPLGWSDTILRVIWPQVGLACAATWYLTYLWVLWDVEVLTLLQIPGGETLALRIFNLLHYGHNDQVNALCLQLIFAAILPWLVWQVGSWVRRRAQFSSVARTRSRAGGVGLLAFAFLLSGCSPSTSTSTAISPPSIPLASVLFQRIEVLGERGTAAGQFNKPRSLTVDRQDNLYVVDMTARVQKFSPDGRFLLMWQLAQTDLGKPKGMACDHEGNIVVVEPHYQRVNHYTTEGKLIRRWGAAGTNVGQLTLPRSVAVDPQGTLWLTEYTLVDRVQAFRLPEPIWLQSFGRPGLGNGEFNRAEGIALDPAGRLFVADSCNHRIQVFSSQGKWVRAYGRAGAGQGELSYPYDIKVDAQGRQYVCEFGNSRIQVFDAADRSLEVIGGYGSSPGLFGNPWSIALDSRGNLYVADSGNHRVQKLVRR